VTVTTGETERYHVNLCACASEAEEPAAAKIRDDAMANVISGSPREPKRMLAIVSQMERGSMQVLQNKQN
jgi:hypothetical protein